jgi:hypothetical protein
MYIKIISDNNDLKRLCYEPLEYGKIYDAEYLNKYYTTVFYKIDGVQYEIDVHNKHLIELNLDEIRNHKLINLISEITN